ncbi:MAG: PAS domain-containing protein [Leptolyngbyaceae cyanobacterium bins.302]|nr:PAS domain-containing protein [Leptolyngbyaceae cyanobacterium bins.302]
MKPSRTTCSDRLFSHCFIEALGRLQIQEPNPNLGSLYIYDLRDQRTLFASCPIPVMLGYTADVIHQMGAVGLGTLIHPDDLNSVSQHYQHFATLRSNDVIMLNYRMKRADGAWYWLHSQETPLVTAIDGVPLQVLGIVRLMPQLLTDPLEEILSRAKFSNNANESQNNSLT